MERVDIDTLKANDTIVFSIHDARIVSDIVLYMDGILIAIIVDILRS